MEVTYQAIGVVHSPSTEPKQTPIPPTGETGERHSVEVFLTLPMGSSLWKSRPVSCFYVIFTRFAERV